MPAPTRYYINPRSSPSPGVSIVGLAVVLGEVVPLLDHVADLANDEAVEHGHEGRRQDQDQEEEVDLLGAPEDRVVDVAYAPVAHDA